MSPGETPAPRAPWRWVEPAVWVGLAALVTVDSLSYPPSIVPGAPGPAFFPRLLAILLVACAALLWWAGRTERTAEGGGRAAWPRVGAAALAIAAFLWLAPRLDGILLLPPLVAALMWAMGERSRLTLIGVPLAFGLFVWAVLFRAMGVALPTRLF